MGIDGTVEVVAHCDLGKARIEICLRLRLGNARHEVESGIFLISTIVYSCGRDPCVAAVERLNAADRFFRESRFKSRRPGEAGDVERAQRIVKFFDIRCLVLRSLQVILIPLHQREEIVCL